MKFRLPVLPYASVVLVFAFLATSANAQESSPEETPPTRPADNYSIGSASALLKPPNTASPRATLKSFIDNMNLAYGTLMKAHRQNLKTPGYFPSKAVRQMANQAEEFFQSAVEC